MENPCGCVLLFALILFLFLSRSQTPAYSALFGPEIGDKSDFNYIEDSGKGPEDWWRRKECWRVCKQGNRQSPIELKEKTAFSDSSLSPLEAFYKSNHAILKNRGHDVMLRWPDGGGDVNIDGVDYTLKQCHWHSPAEHIIDGSRADLELHMVHRTSDDRIAIVAILYKISGFLPDPFLNKLIQPLKVLGNGKRDHVRVGKVDPVAVKGHWPYFRYVGSLTTPPCTQDVVWTVYKEVLSVSHEQLLLLRHAVHDVKLLNRRDRPLLTVSETNLMLNKLQELSMARLRPDFADADLPLEALSTVRLALATNLGRAILEEC